MILYIVRHAWAGHFGDPAWPDDFQRPLTEKGMSRFARVVETLAERGFAPQVVATSPLVRCRQTAEIISKLVPGDPEVVPRDELAPSSDLGGLLRWVARQGADLEQVAWVGHAPDVGHLAAALVGAGSGQIHFSKGATAAIQFDGLAKAGEGELCWLATARILGY